MWALPVAAAAQGTVLIADRLTLEPDGSLVAEGNIEILHEGARITATRIAYDPEARSLTVAGPVTYTLDADTVLVGSSADLDSDLKNGLVRGARMLLQQQMQVAAAEADRIDGRYTVLQNTVASSCRVCDGGPPIWQIRARRVIHDSEERLLFFRDARFELAGVPVMYMPRLVMPDPTVTRATGFLWPEYRSSAILGTGGKLPYFIVLGDSADLKLTPYIAERTTTLEFRYRRAFRAGTLTVSGAVSSDQVMPGELRYYLDASGSFSLPRDFALSFGLQLASDDTYAGEYDYSGSDRLYTFVTVNRTRRMEFIELSASSYLPLASSATQTSYFDGRLTYDRRFLPAGLGGQGRLVLDLQAPGEGSGSDELHATLRLNWRRGTTLPGGLRAGIEADATGDLFVFRPGTTTVTASEVTRFTPTVAADLRWPLARHGGGGVTDFIEPVAQIAWTSPTGPTIPDEDGGLPEFDEGNLIALSRTPGKDTPERGLRAAVGLNFSRVAASGFRADLSLGRVFRAQDLGQFTSLSGLDGPTSDWLVAGQVEIGRLSLSNRTLLDDAFTIAKAETRAAFAIGNLTLSSTHLWLAADAAEGRTTPASELYVAAGLGLGLHWTTSLDYRYDFTAGQMSDAGIGVVYQNECVRVGLTWRNRLVASTSASRESTFGLQVGLNGVGNDGRPYARRCRG